MKNTIFITFLSFFLILSCTKDSDVFESGFADNENDSGDEYILCDETFDTVAADTNVDEDVIDEDVIDEDVIDEDVIDEDVIDEDVIDEDVIDEDVIDEDVIDEDVIDEDVIDEDVIDEDVIDEDVIDEDVIDEDIIDEDVTDDDVLQGRVLWNYDVGSDTYIYYSSVAISSDGKTLYVGTSKKIRVSSSRKDSLLALNSDGTKKWGYDLAGGEEVRSTPVVSDGKVCFLADYRTGEFSKYRTKLFCLNENTGSLAFSKLVSNNTGMSSMGLSKVVAANGKILVVMKYIYVFDIDTGLELFKSGELQTFDQYVNPVVMDNEAVFIFNKTLYFVSMNDYVTRTIDISSIIDSSVLATPALDSQNNIYFGTRNGKMIAIKNDGELIWKKDFNPQNNDQGPFVASSAAIDESAGRIYFGTKGNSLSKFYSLDILTGETKWDFSTGRDIYSSPLIGNNGKIYFGSESQYIYALNPDGSLFWKESVFQDITWPSPAMDDKGVIYIGGMGDGTKNGKVYAIATDSTGINPGVWSKIHKNNQNTGK